MEPNRILQGTLKTSKTPHRICNKKHKTREFLKTKSPWIPLRFFLHTSLFYVILNIAMKSNKDTTNPTITVNRKARYDYNLRDRYEAGVVLQGTEVKAIRAGRLNLTDSYAQVTDGEVFLIDAHIGPYEHGNIANHEPKRKRKLLLNRREITKLERSIRSKGMTIVPTRAYFSNGKVKLELAVAIGKRFYDKRDKIERDAATNEIRAYN